jgi:hypothetical protein
MDITSILPIDSPMGINDGKLSLVISSRILTYHIC